ncbi:MAG: hypothetical protein ACU0A8_05970 [Limimaricola soesokkakensis]|uniref:hypothetical protein n=1 Tax=Limimaricola soesokkakensis TaxID=1343159 RepID=UPI004058AFC0
MTPRPLLFESFDATPTEPEGPGPEWQAGHDVGFEAGREAQRLEAAALSERLVARIEDMAFAHAEARLGLLSGLEPLFETMLDRLLPGLAETVAAVQLRAALMEALQADLAAPLELRLPEAEIDMVRPLLDAMGCDWLTPSPDPRLGPGEAVICGPSFETHLDTGAMIDTAREALSALCAPKKEKLRHG